MAVAQKVMDAVCTMKFARVRHGYVVDAVRDGLLVGCSEKGVRHVPQQPLQKVRGCDAFFNSAFLDHSVAYVFNNANNPFVAIAGFLVLRRAVGGVLLGVVDDLHPISRPEDYALTVSGRADGWVAPILAMLRTCQHICITPVSDAWNENSFFPRLYAVSKVRLQPMGHLVFKFGKRVFGGGAVSLVVGFLGGIQGRSVCVKN